ncbi:hypothetical protein RDABS01_035118 [Bienertia sinuspersici]
MQPPGPPRPFRGAQYDKDMFTFLPAHSKSEIVSESSRKRKSTPDDHQITTSAPNVRDSSSPAPRLRESSNFKGYSDQSLYWDHNDFGAKRHRNERGGYESRSEYAGFSSFSGQLQSSNHKLSSPSCSSSEDCTDRTLNYSPVTKDFNQHDYRERNLHIATHKGPNWPPLVTVDSPRYKNSESNAHVTTHKTSDRHPLVFKDSFQHKIHESDAHIVTHNMPNFPRMNPMMTQGFPQHGNCEPNAHLATHEILNQPPALPHDLNHQEIQGSNAHVAGVENAPQSQEMWSYSHQNAIQPRVTTSNFHEQASKHSGESQRLPQNGLKPEAVIEGLAEKNLYEEEPDKVNMSSNRRSDTDSFAGFDSHKSSGTNVSSSVCNLQSETNNLLNVLRLLSAASGIALADNNDGNIQGCGHDVKMLNSPLCSSIHNLNHSSVNSNLSKNPEYCPNLNKPATNGEKGSIKLGDESKLENGASAFAEKLWDGTLHLSTSVSVSAIAFFKSGDKMQDFNWSDSVEVKGKVRLEAFEKYVQDLPRSRSRGLMNVLNIQ